jgi:hypothetical protein
MRRREFIEGLCLSRAWPLAARGQADTRVIDQHSPTPFHVSHFVFARAFCPGRFEFRGWHDYGLVNN